MTVRGRFLKLFSVDTWQQFLFHELELLVGPFVIPGPSYVQPVPFEFVGVGGLPPLDQVADQLIEPVW
jgi:hypothetical protein